MMLVLLVVGCCDDGCLLLRFFCICSCFEVGFANAGFDYSLWGLLLQCL